MKRFTILCLSLALSMLASHAIADETYVCTYGQEERVITVVFQDQEMKIPCEVRYEKEGTTATLWTAENEVGYCEAKAQELVQKQREWGWLCIDK